MNQVKILGEVHSVEAVRGQPSSYLEEKIPERDVIAGLGVFVCLFLLCFYF